VRNVKRISLYVFLLFLFLFAICISCYGEELKSYPNEPTGFRGFNWGISIESAHLKDVNNFNPNQILKSANNIVIYKYYDGNQYISSEAIDGNILFIFYKNKLGFITIPLRFEGSIRDSSIYQYSRILNKLEGIYSTPIDFDDNFGPGIVFNRYAIWKGPIATIKLLYYVNNFKKIYNFNIQLMNTSILQETISDQKNNSGW
jgi:hypothetical protein